MKSKIEEIRREIDFFKITNKDSLEAFRLMFISKKGLVTGLFDELKEIAVEDRKLFGKNLNDLKNFSQEKYDSALLAIENNSEKSIKPAFDLTLPPTPNGSGTSHPLSIVKRRIIEIFERMGFNISEGPEIETDWYNFTALNFPDNHPAREMQDTFFVEKSQNSIQEDVLLRTHTSNVQIRLMENKKPPLRSIMPGRVFRNEAISARSHCYFHQVEGIYINKSVSFKDLKDTLYHFAKEMFGAETKVRYRPSFFPFTEPSAEIDVSCLICKGEGCNICKHSGWVEIAGSGMVDPAVLTNVGIDPLQFSGFAFGMGVERIAMLKYQVNDLRLFTENDIRFLRQFQGL